MFKEGTKIEVIRDHPSSARVLKGDKGILLRRTQTIGEWKVKFDHDCWYIREEDMRPIIVKRLQVVL